jgi:ubiquitin-protein ligase
MDLNPRTVRRIVGELKDMEKDREILIKDHNIHFHYDDTDITTVRFYIEGPDMDSQGPGALPTPYLGGNYLFDVKYPPNYPFEPLKMSFMTRDPLYRLHPNYYSCGKVCLSSINTWASNDWTAIRTCKGEMISIRSRLDAAPIRYEPAFENTTGDKVVTTNMHYALGNNRCAILGMLTNTPRDFRCFLPLMEDNFLKNYEAIKARAVAEKAKPGAAGLWVDTIVRLENLHNTLKLQRQSVVA